MLGGKQTDKELKVPVSQFAGCGFLLGGVWRQGTGSTVRAGRGNVTDLSGEG